MPAGIDELGLGFGVSRGGRGGAGSYALKWRFSLFVHNFSDLIRKRKKERKTKSWQ